MANRPDCTIVNISCLYFALIANMIAWMLHEEESNNREKVMVPVKICVPSSVCVFFSAASLPPDDDAHTDGGQTIKGTQLCIKLRKIDLPSEITPCPQFFYPNFFKIKLLLVFHETLLFDRFPQPHLLKDSLWICAY